MSIQFGETFTKQQADACKVDEAATAEGLVLSEAYSNAVRRGKLSGVLTAISSGLVLFANTGIVESVESPVLKGALMMAGAVGAFVGGIGLLVEGYQIKFSRDALIASRGGDLFDPYLTDDQNEF